MKQCYLCGTTENLEVHHLLCGIHQRAKAEKYGLTIDLCHRCHMKVQQSPALMRWSRIKGQKMFESKYGNRDDFIKIFGKNYIRE